jgi:CBS domain containing-hemolysin-like protein
MDVHLLNLFFSFNTNIPVFAAPIPEGAEGGTWGGLILYISIAIGLSFLCSVLEAVLLSTSTSYVEMGLETNKTSARLMHKHKDNVERPISAILTLNTIAHTIGATGAGVEAAGIFGNDATALIGAVLTLLILVFSEIIPKTLGATYWKLLNPFAAYAIQGLVLVLYPAVWVFEQMTKLMRPDDIEPTISRAEIETMARIGANEGALQEDESRVLRNLFHLEKVYVRDIMTPRTVVLALSHDMTVRDVIAKHTSLPYSRMPVYVDNMDDVLGFVLRHDIFMEATQKQGDTPIKSMTRDILVVPETGSVAQALAEFTQKKAHIALVIDEYGGTAGILTMEDAIETLLGIEITDESDAYEDLRKVAQERYERQKRLLNQVVGATDIETDRTPDETPDGTPSSPQDEK